MLGAAFVVHSGTQSAKQIGLLYKLASPKRRDIHSVLPRLHSCCHGRRHTKQDMANHLPELRATMVNKCQSTPHASIWPQI